MCYFLARASKEMWFQRAAKGCVYGHCVRRKAIKVSKTNIPDSVFDAITGKVKSIVSSYDPTEGTMLRAIAEHFSSLYDKESRAPSKKRKISALDNLISPDEALS